MILVDTSVWIQHLRNRVLHLLEGRRLHGRGLGWIDAHLLASALLTGCTLWTFDKPLGRAAAALDILE